MAERTPIEPPLTYPGRRPPIPIWTRRVVGLSAARTPLIGRQREIDALCDLVLRSGRRLITVTGPGGIGKSRLAHEVSLAIETEFADGAAFVPLAAVSDPGHVLAAVAQALDIRESAERPLFDALAAALQGRRVLIVLDNFEHVLAAAADVARLLAECPLLTIVVTSREPLRLHGEQRFLTPPLTLPAAVDLATVETLPQFEAIALFVERARSVSHNFVLDEQNAASIVAICQRLDGLPLAIELAAAWVHVLTPPALLERLGRSLALLHGGAEDQPVRLRTMRDAIDWSWHLLTPDEAQLFARLAVFAGGFTLEAAESVAEGGKGKGGKGEGREPDGAGASGALPPCSSLPPFPPSPLPPSVLDLLAALVEKSLVQSVRGDGRTPRYQLLETVREFASERLAASGDEVAARGAHAAYVLDLAEAATRAAGRAGGGEWMQRLGLERPNIRAALDWLEQTGQTEAALRLTGALWHYWYRLGDLAEGRTRLEHALAAAPQTSDPVLRARALRGAGVLAWQSADYDTSRQRLEAALALYRDLGDRAGIGWALNSLGCLFATLAEAEQAEACFTEALAIFAEIDDATGIAQLTANLGELAAGQGDHVLAVSRLTAALERWHALDDRVGAARAQVYLGQSLLARDDAPRAQAVLRDALVNIRDTEYEQILPAALRATAQLAVRNGDLVTAARWYGAADGVREVLGIALPAARRDAYERVLSDLRTSIGETTFAAAWAAGRELSAVEAIADVLASAAALPATAPPAAVDALTNRERDVLRLLVRGWSDKSIAADLGLSRRTVSNHLATIRDKLGASSRSAVVAIAVRDRLV